MPNTSNQHFGKSGRNISGPRPAWATDETLRGGEKEKKPSNKKTQKKKKSQKETQKVSKKTQKKSQKLLTGGSVTVHLFNTNNLQTLKTIWARHSRGHF